MMKKFMMALCLFLLLPVSAFAQEVELAEEFMELTHVNKMMDQIEAQVMQMQDQLLAHMEIPEGKEQAAEEFRTEVRQVVYEIMDFEQMREEYIELFSTVYTEEELREMIRFFKSPAGQNMLEKQSMVIQQAIDISQNRIAMLIPELQRMTEEFEQSLATN
jgi:uncharacterized protein